MRRLLVAPVLALVLLGPSVSATHAGDTRGGGSEARPWLWQCDQILREEMKYRCYVRLLLLDVERSGDPARELPRIDRRAEAAQTSLTGSCHVLMHEVGRRYARAHRLTLGTLQRYVPQSNDPGCSAGFGMGLIMYLGPQILRYGGRAAVHQCAGLPTRYRSYTCVHGIGHALMRAFHGNLPSAVHQCNTLPASDAPDCAQGAFHDYWISLRGADGTTRPAHPVTSPRFICNGHLGWVRPCWYRYFVEDATGPIVETAAQLRKACAGLRPMQRSGCVAGVSLGMPNTPLAQTRLCSRLAAVDAISCLRGVAVQALAGKPRAQLRLIRACAGMPAGARGGCYAWYGRTLAVTTSGTFRCARLATAARAGCVAGARRMRGPLVTFS